MKVGQVMQCDFGNFTRDSEGVPRHDVNGHIPPEIVKNRLVVVMNAKITNACVVVPISATHDRGRWKIASDSRREICNR